MKYLHRISILYLVLPFIFFCFGWLRLIYAIPISAFIIFTLWEILTQPSNNQQPTTNPSPLSNPHLLLTFLWILLSGIGGYTFQNWDHHWRNAVFHDLINFNWPVYYAQPEKGPIEMLVYYVGYWLPAAIAGKLLGWKFANFILFLWTWLGILLVTLQLGNLLKTSAFKATLLLIFFSGLDSIGTLFLAQDYPTLWPPISHLEIWIRGLQYSSFTTQLFWVFNQAVPAWLCITLIMESNSYVPQSGMLSEQKHTHSGPLVPSFQILLWSLCFFFSPLVSIGQFPYFLIKIFKHTDIKSIFKNLRLDLIIASSFIFLLSYSYFSSNTAAQDRGLQLIPFAKFILFFLLEGGLLWLLLAPSKLRDPRWIVTGILLAIIPFIKLGSGDDFITRASIAPLFYLMLMMGETIFQKSTPRLILITCYILLALGALTPLYEINRSIYRTYEYYFVLDENQRLTTPSEPLTHLEQAGALEAEHPNSLVADNIVTLQFMDDKLSKNFIANVRQTLYYRFIAPH